MWALYWRYLFLIMLLLPGMALLNDSFGLVGKLVNTTTLWPTAFWGMFGLLFILASLMQSKGLTYLVWGRRLKLHAAAWCSFNLMLIVLFIALALFGWIFSIVVSPQIWSLYKLYGQSIALLLWPLFAARLTMIRTSSV
ncbi:Intracellular septation protein A [Rheinheimera sp. A13L]|uniref:septation protein IspZ n=1 Tax=Rheinheimera sp. A13L TaxID=506534 RepID=UPI0002124B82|nr:septation protein IspZ [Rheinheimera sp. A13L]EGM79015.1 Intracellular septation protein A [Rheinheimera sp. A13L]